MILRAGRACAALLLAVPASALATEAPSAPATAAEASAAKNTPAGPDAVDASFGLSSGLVTRGISLGSGGPAVQAQATWHASSGWFAGIGAGSFGAPWSRSQTLQFHARVGHALRLSPDWSAQLGYAYYGYPLDAPLRRFEYDELGLSVGYRDLAFLSVSRWLGRRWVLDRHGLDTAVDLVLRHPLAASLDAAAGVGHRVVDGSFRHGYGYGHAGLVWRFEAVQSSLSYIVTTARAERWFGAKAADRWAASVTWSF